MNQLVLDLDDDDYARLRRAAAAAGVSVAEWARRQLARPAADQWSPEVRALVGAWPDAPEADELRPVVDVPRENL